LWCDDSESLDVWRQYALYALYTSKSIACLQKNMPPKMSNANTLCCGRKAFSHLYFSYAEQIDTAKIGDLR
jgi:hypothetical protein